MQELNLSNLNHTWIFDLDGTLLKHNGHLEGQDELLPGVHELFETIPEEDYILVLTSRSAEYEETTKQFLKKCNLRYNNIIFDLPTGERILINDIKPRGLHTAIAVNLERDAGPFIKVSKNNE